MKPYIEKIIQKDTEVDRRYLLSLVRDLKLGHDVSVVYIYELADEFVNYPEKSGRIIYIGEAGRPSEPTGKRFSQHLSTSETKGGDSGTIYSLSRYYWQGRRLRLKIFIVQSLEMRKKVEREIINAHVKKYGSLPICQGTTGSNYKTTNMHSLSISDDVLALL